VWCTAAAAVGCWWRSGREEEGQEVGVGTGVVRGAADRGGCDVVFGSGDRVAGRLQLGAREEEEEEQGRLDRIG
jgi:hypothetical protein